MQQHKLSANMFASSCLLLSMLLSVCSSSNCCNRGTIPCLITLDSKTVFMILAIHLPPIEIKGPSSWNFDSTARSQLVGMYRSGSTKKYSSHCTCRYPGFHDSLRAPNSKSDHSELRHPPLPPCQDYHFRHLLCTSRSAP